MLHYGATSVLLYLGGGDGQGLHAEGSEAAAKRFVVGLHLAVRLPRRLAKHLERHRQAKVQARTAQRKT